MPVPRREINAEFDAVFLTSIRQFPHDIALVRGIGNTIISIATGPQAKTVMVFTSQDHALHASLDQRPHPLFTVKAGRVECAGRSVTIAPFHVIERVETKVDKGVGFQLLPSHLLWSGYRVTRLWRQAIVSHRQECPPHSQYHQ